jgi:hypothetical protein
MMSEGIAVSTLEHVWHHYEAILLELPRIYCHIIYAL